MTRLWPGRGVARSQMSGGGAACRLVAGGLRPCGEYIMVRLLGADEVAAAILLPAGFVALGAEGLFFAEADGAEAIGGDAQRDEILLDGAGAAIAEREVVFGGAALVAVAFDGHAKLRIVAQELGGRGERLASVLANVGFVEIEVSVADCIIEDLVEIQLRLGLDRRRRSADGYARGGVGGAAGTAGGDGIRRGVGRGNFGGTFGADG